MKTTRMSRTTERRNAAKAIAFRGGAPGRTSNIPQNQRIMSGRRLRRASRSARAQLQTYVVRDNGSVERLIGSSSLDPLTLAAFAWR